MVFNVLALAIAIQSRSYDVSCKCRCNGGRFSDGEGIERYWAALSMQHARAGFVETAAADAVTEAGVGAVEASLTYESID